MTDISQVDEGASRRKLPPLSPRGDKPTEDGTKKVVKKKKPKATNESIEKDEPAQDGAPSNKPTKPKRKSRPQSSSRGEGEEKETNGSVVNTEESSAPKKKKRKPKPKDGDEEAVTDRSVTETGENVTGSQASLIGKENVDKGETPKKKGKKKKTKKGIEKEEFGDTLLAADLTYIADDVVAERQKEEDRSEPHFKSSNILRSQPTEKLYIETNRGFKGENKSKLAKKWAEEEETKAEAYVEPSSKTTMEFGLQTHKVLKTFCLFLHGLLAGIALWHIIVVYILSVHDNTDFLEHYRPLALPVQCMFYILLALCTVSACDRCDVGNTSGRFFRKAVSLQNTAIAILIYFLALILSLSIISTEDKINLFSTKPELWENPQESESELSLWKTLNTVRGVAVILGWVVLAIAPNSDRLGDNLREGDDDEILGKDVELSGITSA
ncbi:transmembrane protein 237 [Patella vulgata]|uniref:transmembrane protein 237 n=1 Tax=Patella vulgata TaxID=6465 RepID=UPI00217F9231|nr:transmembrane protein 237 [Patella vulgata]